MTGLKLLPRAALSALVLASSLSFGMSAASAAPAPKKTCIVILGLKVCLKT